jgi:hypothetical protein
MTSVSDMISDAAFINAARRIARTEPECIDIPDGMDVSRSEDGAWVQALVWVDFPEVTEET